MIDVSNLARLDGSQQAYQPVTLLVPILRAHDSFNLPQGLERPEPLPPYVISHNVGLKLRANLGRAVGAHAHQSGASARQRFEGRDGDAILSAMAIDLGHCHRQVESAAHLEPLFAAAIESCALV